MREKLSNSMCTRGIFIVRGVEFGIAPSVSHQPCLFQVSSLFGTVFSTVLEMDGDIQIGGRSGSEFNFLQAELNAIFETIDFDKYQSFRFTSPVYLRYKIFLVL